MLYYRNISIAMTNAWQEETSGKRGLFLPCGLRKYSPCRRARQGCVQKNVAVACYMASEEGVGKDISENLFPISLSSGPQTIRSFPLQARLPPQLTLDGNPQLLGQTIVLSYYWKPFPHQTRQTVLLWSLPESPQLEQMLLFSESSQRTLSQTYP